MRLLYIKKHKDIRGELKLVEDKAGIPERRHNKAVNLLIELANHDFEYHCQIAEVETKHYEARERLVKEALPEVDFAVDVFRQKTDKSPVDGDLSEAAVIARSRFWKDKTIRIVFMRHWETKHALQMLRLDLHNH